MRSFCLLVFLAGLFAPSVVLAQGDDFYRCTKKDGSLVITNRHQSSDWVKCQPFELNRDFKAAEQRRRSEPVSVSSERYMEEAAGAARSSAESARVSAESARGAAAAARDAAEAADSTLVAPAPPPPPPGYYDSRK